MLNTNSPNLKTILVLLRGRKLRHGSSLLVKYTGSTYKSYHCKYPVRLIAPIEEQQYKCGYVNLN